MRPEILSRRVVLAGRKFDFEQLTIAGASGQTLTREHVRHPGAVVIVARLDDGRLVMIRNWRFGLGETLLELPAGTLEPAEDPAVCAKRELIEETGYSARTIAPLGRFFSSPGLTDECMHVFLATGLSHVGQKLEDDESITVELVSPDQALAMVHDGELHDGKSIAALHLALCQRR